MTGKPRPQTYNMGLLINIFSLVVKQEILPLFGTKLTTNGSLQSFL